MSMYTFIVDTDKKRVVKIYKDSNFISCDNDNLSDKIIQVEQFLTEVAGVSLWNIVKRKISPLKWLWLVWEIQSSQTLILQVWNFD